MNLHFYKTYLNIETAWCTIDVFTSNKHRRNTAAILPTQQWKLLTMTLHYYNTHENILNIRPALRSADVGGRKWPPGILTCTRTFLDDYIMLRRYANHAFQDSHNSARWARLSKLIRHSDRTDIGYPELWYRAHIKEKEKRKLRQRA